MLQLQRHHQKKSGHIKEFCKTKTKRLKPNETNQKVYSLKVFLTLHLNVSHIENSWWNAVEGVCGGLNMV